MNPSQLTPEEIQREREKCFKEITAIKEMVKAWKINYLQFVKPKQNEDGTWQDTDGWEFLIGDFKEDVDGWYLYLRRFRDCGYISTEELKSSCGALDEEVLDFIARLLALQFDFYFTLKLSEEEREAYLKENQIPTSEELLGEYLAKNLYVPIAGGIR